MGVARLIIQFCTGLPRVKLAFISRESRELLAYRKSPSLGRKGFCEVIVCDFDTILVLTREYLFCAALMTRSVVFSIFQKYVLALTLGYQYPFCELDIQNNT